MPAPAPAAPALPAIFCAADTPDMDHAKALAAAMQKAECGLKLGLEFFSAQGGAGVHEIRKDYPDLPIFLDLKLHDIPNTVAGAVRALCALSPAFLTVHASGGPDMLRAAAEAARAGAEEFGAERTPCVLGVTVLTSLDEAALAQAGFLPGLEDRVAQLAGLARKSGLGGIVCAAAEIESARAVCGPGFTLMVPGIRPEGAETGDQKRVTTPQQALAAGADHLVIGRPITRAENPAIAAQEIRESLAA
jgi:orotidine-5'-phosphate decarboxylase